VQIFCPESSQKHISVNNISNIHNNSLQPAQPATIQSWLVEFVATTAINSELLLVKCIVSAVNSVLLLVKCIATIAVNSELLLVKCIVTAVNSVLLLVKCIAIVG